MSGVYFSFPVPVIVHVVDGEISSVNIDDSVPISCTRYVDGDQEYMDEAVKIAKDINTTWPSWDWL